MDNTTVDMDGLVEKINDEMVLLLLPATLYICILMTSGLVGNLMVCFYYSFKTRITPTSVFIVTLSVFDLLVCSISMPTELVDIFQFYTFTNETACKVLRFINYYAAIASAFTLIMIAVDRYKHVCWVTSEQMSVSAAKKYIVLIIVIALVPSWPSVLIYNLLKLPLPTNIPHGNLTGIDCSSANADSSKPYVWAFNIFHAVGFFVCVALLTTLYSLIGYTLYKHRQQLSRYQSTTKASAIPIQGLSLAQSDPRIPRLTAMIQSTTLENEQDENINLEPRQNTRADIQSIRLDDNEQTEHVKPRHSAPQEQETDMDDVQRNRRVTGISSPSKVMDGTVSKTNVRLTVLMVTVTVVFILSFLPYLSLILWRLYKGYHETLFLTHNELVAYVIGSRSFLLNSSLNPWIYGIFNRGFRQYYYRLLCCKSA